MVCRFGRVVSWQLLLGPFRGGRPDVTFLGELQAAGVFWCLVRAPLLRERLGTRPVVYRWVSREFSRPGEARRR